MPGPTELIDDTALDAALDRTYRRYGALRARQQTRRRWIAAGAMAGVLAIAAVGVPMLRAADPQVVPAGPARGGTSVTTTTLDPDAALPVPEGFTLSRVGEAWLLERVLDPPRPIEPGVSVATSSKVVERAGVSRFRPGPVPRSVVVELTCVTTLARVEQVAYTVSGGVVTVDATVDHDPLDPPCGVGQPGPEIALPLEQPLPEGAQVVAGSVRIP